VSLIERLQALEVGESGERPCPVAKLLDGLDDETAEVLRRLLANQQRSTRAIHTQLHAAGVRIGRDTLSACRRACWCGRITG
jgi:hypothetical protein